MPAKTEFIQLICIFTLMKQLLSIIVILLSSYVGTAQPTSANDDVFLEHLKSVKFHISGLPTSMPIIDLNSTATLELSFDDILGGDRNYSYRLVHCDKDWVPTTQLDELEYIDGFNNKRIRDYDYSNGTRLNYTHYKLTLPNRDIRWRLSGNYLLEVYDDDSDELALTRRFAVVERGVKIGGEVTRVLSGRDVNSHHQLLFKINHKDFTIRNPQRELFVTAIKNSQWPSAIHNITPQAVMGYDILFDRTVNITFPAGRDYRGIDLRAVRARGLGVYRMEVTRDEIVVTAELDQNKRGWPFAFFNDLNGDFVIESREVNNAHIRAEYINTIFTLDPIKQVVDGEVYLMGEFSDWLPREEYRMQYQADQGVYVGQALLKQGYYDYTYGVVYDDGVLDLSYFEDDLFGTVNEYTLLCFIREFGARYDRLIGAIQFRNN